MIPARDVLLSDMNTALAAFVASHGVQPPVKHQRPKVVRDALWGLHELSPAALAIVASAFFQRLRHIYQTSLALLTYPGAVHSRFEHSLGVAHVALRMME